MRHKVESDPYRELDAMLDRWAHYRARANRLPGGHYVSALARMQAEGAEVERGGDALKAGLEFAIAVRRALKARIEENLLRYRDGGDPWNLENAGRYGRALQRFPRTTSKLAWASLIRGEGLIRDREYPEEERVDRAVENLPPMQCEIIFRIYHVPPYPWRSQKDHAAEMGLATRTFDRYLSNARETLRRALEC